MNMFGSQSEKQSKKYIKKFLHLTNLSLESLKLILFMKVVKFFDEFSSQKEEYDTFLGSNACQNKPKLLFNQMPKQDISAQFCHHVLGNKAFKNYKSFIEKRNTKSMDIGLCLKNYSNINLVIFLYFKKTFLAF